MSLYEEMLALVGQLGAQLREGHAAGQEALGAPRPTPPASATISALGGSAIGGSLAEALWRDSLRAPTSVNRAAALPGWVAPGHLVVAVSYSGATAETPNHSDIAKRMAVEIRNSARVRLMRDQITCASAFSINHQSPRA